MKKLLVGLLVLGSISVFGMSKTYSEPKVDGYYLHASKANARNFCLYMSYRGLRDFKPAGHSVRESAVINSAGVVTQVYNYNDLIAEVECQ